MSEQLPGLHHMTAICGDAQKNVDFYAGVLGLRLVKKTVNFDDPGTYHLYYGDAFGTPGSILTFFAWPGAFRGRRGLGQATATALTVPDGALGYWRERLAGAGAEVGDVQERFGSPVLPFLDHDGLALEIVERSEASSETAALRADAPVPAEYAIRRMDGVTLTVTRREPSETLLTQVLGFQPVAEENDRIRLTASAGESGTLVDLLITPDGPRANLGTGVVHHIAWRTPDDATQAEWRSRLLKAGRSVSPVMDRDYFHSIYFHEPGGVLFEIATNPPGFTVDEPQETLGTQLCLPPWLEENRPTLERTLPALRIPGNVVGAASGR